MEGKFTKKNIHGSPKDAGAKNLAKATSRQLRMVDEGLSMSILDTYKTGLGNRGTYGGQYTGEELLLESNRFLQHCGEVGLKPSMPLYALWLGVSQEVVGKWAKEPKYEEKHSITREIKTVMEAFLQADIDKHPTGNIFLLKTSHGHVEANRLDVTSNGETVSDKTEVDAMIKKLGIDENYNK